RADVVEKLAPAGDTALQHRAKSRHLVPQPQSQGAEQGDTAKGRQLPEMAPETRTVGVQYQPDLVAVAQQLPEDVGVVLTVDIGVAQHPHRGQGVNMAITHFLMYEEEFVLVARSEEHTS